MRLTYPQTLFIIQTNVEDKIFRRKLLILQPFNDAFI